MSAGGGGGGGGSSGRQGCCCCCFGGSVRYLILILTTISLVLLYANVVVFYFAQLAHSELPDAVQVARVGRESSRPKRDAQFPALPTTTEPHPVAQDAPPPDVVERLLGGPDATTEAHPVAQDPPQANSVTRLPFDFSILSTFSPATTPSQWQKRPRTTRHPDIEAALAKLRSATTRAAVKLAPPTVETKFLTNEGWSDDSPSTTGGRRRRPSTSRAASVSPSLAYITTPESLPYSTDVTEAPAKRTDSRLAVADKDAQPTASDEQKVEAPEKVEDPSDKMTATSPTSDDEGPDVASISSISWKLYAQRASLWAAPGIGALVAALPAQWALHAKGARASGAVALSLSGVATIAVPLALDLGGPTGIHLLEVLRILQGVGLAFATPLAGRTAARWASVGRQFGAVAMLFLFVQLAPLLTWTAASWAESAKAIQLFGRDRQPLVAVYLVQGLLSILVAILFGIFYRDRPQHHPWVGALELNRLVAGKVKELRDSRRSPHHHRRRQVDNPSSGSFDDGTAEDRAPETYVLRSGSAWAALLASLAFFLATAHFAMFLPTTSALLSSEAQKRNPASLSALMGAAAMPHFAFFIFYALGRQIARLACCRAPTTQVRVLGAGSLVISAITLIASALLVLLDVPETSSVSAATVARIPILSTISLAALGLAASAGWLRSAVVVGRYYSQHIVAHSGIAFALALTLWPFVAFALAAENTPASWQRVSLALAAILLVAALLFGLFGRGRVSGWASRGPWEPDAARRMLTLDPIDYGYDECGLEQIRLYGNGK